MERGGGETPFFSSCNVQKLQPSVVQNWPGALKSLQKRVFLSNIIHLLYRGISFPWQHADT